MSRIKLLAVSADLRLHFDQHGDPVNGDLYLWIPTLGYMAQPMRLNQNQELIVRRESGMTIIEVQERVAP